MGCVELPPSFGAYHWDCLFQVRAKEEDKFVFSMGHGILKWNTYLTQWHSKQAPKNICCMNEQKSWKKKKVLSFHLISLTYKLCDTHVAWSFWVSLPHLYTRGNTVSPLYLQMHDPQDTWRANCTLSFYIRELSTRGVWYIHRGS